MLYPSAVECEMQKNVGLPGAVYLGEAAETMEALRETYAGRVQLIYMDPPYLTGKRYVCRMRVGEREWRTGTGTVSIPAYSDPKAPEPYYAMMRAVLVQAHALLSETGALFLHVDYRAQARLRLMADDIFGEQNFVNEIIWVYQTGGRSKNYFSRKHDVILFYRKSEQLQFDIEAVSVPRDGNRNNHMKRHVDTDGRAYRSIRSGGKIYTYYDDDMTYPSDVWDDVSHMQQKDPQRTGYDTQKPLALLTRIVRCASRADDWVLDPFAGSGTTLEAAWRQKRRFLGIDRSPAALQAMRRRLSGANVVYHAAASEGMPLVEAQARLGIAYYDVELTKYELEPGLAPRPMEGLEAVDSWAVGYLRPNGFDVQEQALRDRKSPALPGMLKLPVFDGEPMLRVSDVLGRSFYYLLDMERVIR